MQNQLLADIEAFIDVHGMAESTFGREALGDWRLIDELRGRNRSRPRRLWPETEAILHQRDTGPRNALRIAKGTSTADDFTSLTYYPIVADVGRGAMAVTLTTPMDASNFAPGQLAWIRARQCVSGGTTEPVAELVEVLSANATTGVVAFAYPLTKEYVKDTTGTIYTYGLAPVTDDLGAPLDNLHVADLTLRSDGGNYVLWLRHARNAIVERVQTLGRAGIAASAGTTGFTLRDCDVNIINELQDNWLYFFALDKGSKHALITGNTFRSTGAGTLHLHEGVADVVVQANRFLLPPTTAVSHTIDWPVISIAGSSWDIRILDNLLVNGPFAAIRVSNSWKYAAPQHEGLRISGNRFEGEFGRDWNVANAGDMGVILDGDVTDYEISRNIFNCTVPATGKQLKISGTGVRAVVDDNSFSGSVAIPLGTRGSNTQTSNIDAYVAEPVWQVWGNTSNRGPQLRTEVAGQNSPPLWMGNATDASWVNVFGSPSGTFNVFTGGTPGATLGTVRCQISSGAVNFRNLSLGILYDNVRILTARKTGWATATGTATRATFDTATVTTEQLAERVKALIDDLHGTAGHGLIGT